jgi:hypothetical protein
VINRTMVVIALVLLAVGVAAAQETASRLRVFGSVGVGASVPTSGGDAITNMAQLVFEKKTRHAAFRILLLHDIDRNTNEIGEIGPLYGRTREHSWGRTGISTGFSWVGFYHCPDDDTMCSTLGLPVVAEAAIGRKFAGVGIHAFANVNGTASYAGAVLILQIGRLR